MSWQLPQRPPEPEKRRGFSGIDPDAANGCWGVPACCIIESLTWSCCWWPALAGLAALGLLVSRAVR